MTSERTCQSSTNLPCPILVVSPNSRCGTNWISNTLRAHPACTGSAAPSLGEDWFAFGSKSLVEYVESVARTGYGWTTPADPWELEKYGASSPEGLLQARKRELMARLGESLIHFARPMRPDAQHIVFKQTLVNGLEHVSMLWPQARAIVLIRDGRDVIESIRRTWEHRAQDDALAEIRVWRDAIRRIKVWLQSPPLPLLMVKYEQLVAEPERKLRQIFAFLNLETSKDFLADAAKQVHGSSDIRLREGVMDFRARPMSADFNPLERAANWTEQAQQRFVQEAGAELRWLGYPI